jgi:hypothetical protein
MKQLIKQIEFINNTLLPIFGISNLTNYDKIICLQNFDEIENLVENLNKILDDFKEVFPIKNFNLHKTNNKIISHNNAFNFLKKCLEVAMIPFSCYSSDNKKYLRLISINKTLYRFIMENNTESSEIRSSEDKIIKIDELVNKIDDSDKKKVIKGEDIIKEIKKEYNYNFMVRPNDVLKDGRYDIDLKNYELNDKIIKSCKITLKSMQEDNKDIISLDFINSKLLKALYAIEIGGSVAFRANFVNGMNIIPTNVLLMNNLLMYHQAHLVIHKIDDIASIINILIFDIEVIYVDLYERMNALCVPSNHVEFMLEKNMSESVKLIYAENMGGCAGNINIKENNEMDFIGDIKYDETSIGSVKGLRINDSKSNQECLKLLIAKNPNFVVYNHLLDESNVKKYATNNDGKIINKYNFMILRNGDLVSNVTLNFGKRQLKSENLKMFLCCGELRKELKLFSELYGELYSQIENMDYYNMLGDKQHEPYISIEYEHDNILFNLFDQLIIHYDYYFLQARERKLLTQQQVILSIDDIEKVFKIDFDRDFNFAVEHKSVSDLQKLGEKYIHDVSTIVKATKCYVTAIKFITQEYEKLRVDPYQHGMLQQCFHLGMQSDDIETIYEMYSGIDEKLRAKCHCLMYENKFKSALEKYNLKKQLSELETKQLKMLDERREQAIKKESASDLFHISKEYWVCGDKINALRCCMTAYNFTTDDDKHNLCQIIEGSIRDNLKGSLECDNIEQVYDMFLELDDKIKNKCSHITGFKQFKKNAENYKIVKGLK